MAQNTCALQNVAPLVGAWIERFGFVKYACGVCVAPLVGAWIERESVESMIVVVVVAPLVGAWIESHILQTRPMISSGRSSCRSVD